MASVSIQNPLLHVVKEGVVSQQLTELLTASSVGSRLKDAYEAEAFDRNPTEKPDEWKQGVNDL